MGNGFTVPPRLLFSPGQILVADDWQAEQRHWLARWQRHLRFMHGWGVVAGLEVRLSGAGALVVQPGLAIDCAGQELALDQATTLALPPLTGRLYLTLAYLAQPSQPVPRPPAPDELPGEALAYTRVSDGVVLALAATNPAAGHRHLGPGTPGCGQGHALCIASVAPGRAGPRVDQRSRLRRPRG